MSPNQQPRAAGPFHPGALIIATLSGPREKFWGAILDLTSEGLSLRGIELGFFENFVSQIKAGEPFTSGVVFFPVHRVERLELDLPEGNIPSLAHRFTQQTGQDAADVLIGEFLVRTGGEVGQ